MAKVFYTERDIEDMVQRGVRSLLVTDDVVLTELAYERAKRLGLALDKENVTAPSAPVRPYISETIVKPMLTSSKPCEKNNTCASVAVQADTNASTIKERVRNAVKVRFGEKIDDNLLEAIIQRVLNSVGV
jgi:hypothetical protein